MSDFTVLRERIQRAGIPAQAANWLLKALSPATPTGTGATIADSVSVPVSIPEMVTTAVIAAPTAAKWDAMVLTVPGYPTQAVIIAGPSPVDFTSATTWTNPNNVVTVVQVEPTTSTNSIPLSASIFTVGSSTANFVYVAGNVPYPSTQPISWRLSYASTTQYLTTSALYDEGTVTSGMVPCLQRRLPATVVGGVYGGIASSGVLIMGVAGIDLPMNEAELTSMDSKVRVAPAKNGCYQPLYQGDGVFKWNSGSPVPGVISSYINPTTATPVFYYPSSGTSTVVTLTPGFLSDVLQFISPATDIATYNLATLMQGAAGNFPWSMGWADSMIGVTFYRGLDANSTLTIKAVSGYEIVPCPTSPIRQFMVPGGMYSPQAMQLYTELVANLPHSYPASSNFLGSVLSAISGLLPLLLPHVPAVIRAIRGEPTRYAAMTAEMPRAVTRARSKASKSRSRSRSVSMRRVRIASVSKKRAARPKTRRGK